MSVLEQRPHLRPALIEYEDDYSVIHNRGMCVLKRGIGVSPDCWICSNCLVYKVFVMWILQFLQFSHLKVMQPPSFSWVYVMTFCEKMVAIIPISDSMCFKHVILLPK